jgi:NADH-quinone oxidoreductase subunit N
MTATDFLSLLPLMIIATAAIIIMLTVAVTRNFNVIFGFSILAFILAFLSIFRVPIPTKISSLLVIDGFSLLLFGIIILASLLVTLLSHRYLLYQESEKEEYLIILFVAALGSMLLAAACSFVTLFLGLETLSISLYILISYRRTSGSSIESGVKYLILASVSSTFLLFGLGLIYLCTGSFEFSRINFTAGGTGQSLPILLAGFGMMIVGMGFKLALVPFHMWTPDVYQGAPVSVTAFIATVSKGAVMAILLRFFYTIQGFQNVKITLVITILAVLSMFAGNLLALRQQNVKRILAYSSIANMGYLLVTLLVGKSQGYNAAVFYIVSYILATLAAFGVISLLSGKNNDAEMTDDYEGLFWKNPFVATVFTLALLSLAGIPLTTGFMAKFYVLFTGINSNLWVLVISLIVNSVIGLYYYLRLVKTMFSSNCKNNIVPVSIAGYFVLGLLFIGILWLGVFPHWAFQFIAGISGI